MGTRSEPRKAALYALALVSLGIACRAYATEVSIPDGTIYQMLSIIGVVIAGSIAIARQVWGLRGELVSQHEQLRREMADLRHDMERRINERMGQTPWTQERAGVLATQAQHQGELARISTRLDSDIRRIEGMMSKLEVQHARLEPQISGLRETIDHLRDAIVGQERGG